MVQFENLRIALWEIWSIFSPDLTHTHIHKSIIIIIRSYYCAFMLGILTFFQSSYPIPAKAV